MSKVAFGGAVLVLVFGVLYMVLQLFQLTPAKQILKSEELFQKGVLKFNENEFEDALYYFSKTLELFPNHEKCLLTRGMLYFAQEKYEESLEDLNRIIDFVNPSNARALEGRGKVFSKTQRLDDSIKDFKKVLKIEKENVEVLKELGEILRLEKRYNESLSIFEQANSISLDEENFFSRSLIFLSLEQYEDALMEINSAIELKNKVKFLNIRGLLHRVMGNLELSIDDYYSCIHLDEDFADAWNNLGVIYFNQHRYEEALDHFTKFIELRTLLPKGYQNRVVIYRALQDYEKAHEDYTTLIELFEQHEEEEKEDLSFTLLDRGMNYADMGKFDEAIQDIDRAIELIPENDAAYVKKAEVYRMNQQYEKALEQYEFALEMNPQYAFCHFRMSQVFISLKQPKEALEHAKEATELNENELYANHFKKLQKLQEKLLKKTVQ